jgi:hypothetical protein
LDTIVTLTGQFRLCTGDTVCATRSANVGLYGNCFVTQWDYVSCVGVHGKDVTGKQDQVAGGFVAQIVNGTSVRLNNGTVLNNVQWD